MESSNRITLGRTGHIELYFPYAGTKDVVRTHFRGVTYDWPGHCWKAPYNRYNLQAAEEWAHRCSIKIEPEKWLSESAYRDDVFIPLFRESLALEPQKPFELVREMVGNLYPFQEAAIQYALKRKRCFFADPSGTGKTIMALATIAMAHAFPAVVVCPPALLPHWKDEIAKWFPSWQVQLLKGEIHLGNQRVYIVGYSQLKNYIELLKAIKPRSIIFDESHRLKGYETQQTNLSYELAKRIDYRFLLTGTPVVNRPADLMSQLKVMGRWDVLVNVRYFSETYCGAWYDGGDKSPTGAANLSSLDIQLRIYCMIRRTEEQLRAHLPVKFVIPVYLQLDRQIDNLWDGWFRSARIDVQELRRNAYKVKRRAVIEWLDETCSADGKTVVFGYHTEYIQELAGIFSGLVVTGDHSLKQIQETIHGFRNDPDAKFLFLTYGIGSQGWQLDFADRVVMVELDWSDSTHQRAEGRLSSMIREKAIQIYRLLARGTYEDHMLKIIEEKRANVTKITE
jgi:SWI/SNF-related matrix-associated actin-dependent regulator of chromatin subfamily A-like protein 1